MLQTFTHRSSYQTFPKAAKQAIKEGQLVQIGGADDALSARAFAPTVFGTPTTTPLIGVATEDSSIDSPVVRVIISGEAKLAISPLDTTNYNALAAKSMVTLAVNPTDGLVSTGVAGEVPVRKRANIMGYRAGTVYLDNGKRYARIFI
jgi:hypothetical protein